jgi:hypothetical protein
MSSLAEFRDQYEPLIVAACEWRAMHTDPDPLADRVFSLLATQSGEPGLRAAYRALEKVVFDSYLEASATVSIMSRLKGEQRPVPNAPADTAEEKKLRDGVAKLRRRDRDLLQRAYWDELSENELAEVEGADVRTVIDRREQALNNYRKVVARLLPGTDAGLASKLFRSVKPGIRTRWE